MSSLRLKEQDALIDLIRRFYNEAKEGGEGNPAECGFRRVQGLLSAHYHARCGGGAGPTELSALCPGLGNFFVELDVVSALYEYDFQYNVSKRKWVPLTFSEVRSVLNLAVVAACAPSLQLLTFDADDTLYNDGGCLSFDAPCIPFIIRLLRLGIRVAVVTAASYPGVPSRYEQRLAGLLSAMAFAVEAGAPPGPLCSNFFVMGGQCNYALRTRCVTSPAVRIYLEAIPDEEWKHHRGVRWDPAEVKATLDVAEDALRSTANTLKITECSTLIRKERAVGLIANNSAVSPLSYEVRSPPLSSFSSNASTTLNTARPHTLLLGSPITDT
jgi:IMP and pyridine-specific 5'-nucleotidase